MTVGCRFKKLTTVGATNLGSGIAVTGKINEVYAVGAGRVRESRVEEHVDNTGSTLMWLKVS